MKIETLELLHDLLDQAVENAQDERDELIRRAQEHPEERHLVPCIQDATLRAQEVEQARRDFLQESWH